MTTLNSICKPSKSQSEEWTTRYIKGPNGGVFHSYVHP